jgi:hypothetical protein
MKEYPKIFGPAFAGITDTSCIAFYKYDGSNLRFEWNRKRGWYKFGTRRRLFDHTDPEYGEAIDLFMTKYADGVIKQIKNHRLYRQAESVIAYAEFFGPHTFAGKHDAEFLGVETNDPKELVLFDVNVHKRGFIPPHEFVDLFQSMPIAEVVYRGIFDEQFVQDVREGKYPVDEGVIVKGGTGHDLWMRKVKTLAYLEELKTRFPEIGKKWQDFWE